MYGVNARLSVFDFLVDLALGAASRYVIRSDSLFCASACLHLK